MYKYLDANFNDMRNKFNNKYRIASTRLQNWDYGWNAAYFVTVCTKNRVQNDGISIPMKLIISKPITIGQNGFKITTILAQTLPVKRWTRDQFILSFYFRTEGYIQAIFKRHLMSSTGYGA